ncbi:MAG: hypothetical protein N4A76_07500 [Firmicutes bacterium]|nr:hypothetical protein [Bacillota bacterium]
MKLISFKNVFIVLIVILVIMIVIVQNNLEVRVVLKNFANQELTLDEIRNSRLYGKYEEIQLNDTYEDVEKMFGKAGVENAWGLLHVWKYSYGSVQIGCLNNKIIHKHVVFYNSPRYQISEEDTKGIKGITTFDEVELRVGKSMEYGKSIDIKNQQMNTTYIWKNQSNEVLKISFSEGTVYDIDWIK